MRDDQVHRYARHILLPEIGGVGQRRLLDATVAVKVHGGVPAATVAIAYLAAAGVGTIVLAIAAAEAETVVTEADVRSGVLLETADLGTRLTEAIAMRVRTLNPDVRVVVGVPSEATPIVDLTSTAAKPTESHARATATALADACAAVTPLLFGVATREPVTVSP